MSMRIRRFIVGGLVVMITGLVGAGCGADDPGVSEDELRVIRAESFDGWVLDSAAAYATYQTHPMVFEGLLRFGSDGESVEPGLADEWVYDEEESTWTFRIGEGATFSDGTPVTSDDVAFSLEVWQDGPNFGPLFEEVRRVRTPDQRTAVFEMERPNSVFDALLAASVSGIMPEDFGGSTEDDFYRDPVGAGPYQVEEWSRGGEIVLTPNDHYHDPEGRGFQRIVMDVVPDDTQALRLFEAGDAQIVEYVPTPVADQYDQNRLEQLPPSQIIHLSLNTEQAPFDDIAVRRAIAHAIDYDSIVNGPLQGYAEPASGILSPNVAHWAPPSDEYFSTNLDLAREELADSDHGDGFTAELIFDAALRRDDLVAQVIQSNLAELGIDVQVRGLETGAFVDRAFALDADMVLWTYGAVSPDMVDPLGWILGTNWLFTGFELDTLGEIYDRYVEAESESQRLELVTEFQDHAAREIPAISLAEFEVIHAVADGIDGFEPAPWGLYYYDTLSAG
jgi:peptide/nickel transport system substrate-binding protein